MNNIHVRGLPGALLASLSQGATGMSYIRHARMYVCTASLVSSGFSYREQKTYPQLSARPSRRQRPLCNQECKNGSKLSSNPHYCKLSTATLAILMHFGSSPSLCALLSATECNFCLPSNPDLTCGCGTGQRNRSARNGTACACFRPAACFPQSKQASNRQADKRETRCKAREVHRIAEI